MSEDARIKSGHDGFGYRFSYSAAETVASS